jgi:4-aminobutyrate aminotransferase-like enzyme
MGTSTSQTTILAAREVARSPAVAAAIDAILRELRDAQAGIGGVRPPAPELAEGYDAALRRLAAFKGRPALYPYVGSGLGRGALVQLADGSVKWDLINGIGVYPFGHGDPDLIATALRAALRDTVMQGNLQFDECLIAFGEFLVAHAARGSRLAHCFVINSGALANESALKVCFQKNAPASRVLAFEDCFAGRTTTMVQIGDSAAGRVGIPVTIDVDYLPFFDPDRPQESSREAQRRLRQYLERHPGQHACIVVELIQGEGGFNVAPREFFVPLLEVCREQGIGVWFDEIQTFGRTPSLFYYDELELGEYADVVTVGKISQVCACLYTPDYNPQAGLLSATFAGSTVGLEVGRRILERLTAGGYYGPGGRIARLQEAFRAHMDDLLRRRPEWFPPASGRDGAMSQRFRDGVGGMMRFTPFGGQKPRIDAALRAMFDEGVIAFYCGRGPYHVRFLPAVGVMEPDDFDSVFEVLEAALERAARET